MRRKTIAGLAIAIGLITAVVVKNVYVLDKRLETDEQSLQPFENELLIIQMPSNLVHENDTTYLASGEVLNIVQGVAGSIRERGEYVHYALSVAN